MPTLSSHIVRRKLASVPDVEEALARQILYGGDLVTNLLELSAVSEPLLVNLLAENFGLEPAPPGVLPVAMPEVKKLIGAEVALLYSVFPLKLEEGRLDLAVFEPLPAAIEQDLVFSLGVRIFQRVAPLVRIRQAIARDYDRPLDKRTARVLAQLEGRNDPHPSLTPTALPNESRGLGRLPRPQSVLPPRVITEERSTLRPRAAEPMLSAQREPTPTSTRPPPPTRAPAKPPRRLGPYTVSMAERDLFTAESRDQVLFALFDFAAQYFEYTALFVVHGELAEGRLARGPGASSEQIQKLGVPLDLESVLSSAHRAGHFKLAALANTGVDSTLAEDLGRPTGRRVLLLPVAVKARSVLLLFGDHGRNHVKLADIGDVLALGALVGSTLERMIVSRKSQQREGGSNLFSVRPLPRPGSQFVRPARQDQAQALISALGDSAPNATDALAVNAFLEQDRHATLPGLSGAPSVSILPRAIDVTPPMGTPIVASAPPPRPSTQARPTPRTQPVSHSQIISSDPPPFLRPPLPPAPPPSRPKPEYSEPLPIPLTKSKPPLRTQEPPESGWDASGAAPLGAQHLEVVAEADSERASAASRTVSVAALEPRPGRKSDSHNLPTVIVDLASNCQTLVSELISGNLEAGNQLVQIGGPAASALAARLPGPIQMDYLNALGEIQVRASQCGPLLRTLSRLGAQAAPFVALRTLDSDPTARAWATHLLAEMPSDDAARAIVKRLFDDDPEVRKVAISAGRSMQSNSAARLSFLDQLAAHAANRDAPEGVRMAAISALESLREPQGVPTLIALLAAENPKVVQAAHTALLTLTREDLGSLPEGWQKWWEQNSHRHRIEWLIDALMSDTSGVRSAASEELKSLTKEYFGYYEDLPKRERSRAQQRYRDWWESRGKSRFD